MIHDPIRSSRPALAILVLSALLACGRSQAAEVVARVGGEDVTTEELRAHLGTLGAADQEALAKDPALLAQVVRTYLASRAVLKEAESRKWGERPEVRSQLERVRAQALTELYLQAVSKPPDAYPPDAEVQAAYEANRKVFEVPRQYRLAQIYLASASTSGEAEEKAKRRAGELARKAKQKGTDFGALAREVSEEKSTAGRGGELGWMAESQLLPGIRAAVSGLAPGGVSDPIRLDDGWHVVKLLELRPPSVRPLAEVRATLVAQFRADRARSLRQAYLATLLEKNPPALNELELAKALPQAFGPSPAPGSP